MRELLIVIRGLAVGWVALSIPAAPAEIRGTRRTAVIAGIPQPDRRETLR